MRMPEINLETNSFDGVTYHGSIVIPVSKPTQTVVTVSSLSWTNQRLNQELFFLEINARISVQEKCSNNEICFEKSFVKNWPE